MTTRSTASGDLRTSHRWLVPLAMLSFVWTASADPDRAPPHPAASGARPVPSAVRERLQQMMEKRGDRQPGDLRDRMEQMRERIREARERREHVRTATHDLDEGLRKGDMKREDLDKRIDEYKKLRAERRLEHRAEIFRMWGLGLSQPEVKAELEMHARRMAKLRRLEILVATDRKGEKRKKLADRIDQLREREKERHHTAMVKLLPARAAAASAVAAASVPNPALPAPSASPAPAASGGQP
ncbi:MAG TPA: hypothetical protein VFQ61_02780 [Polyangiaceae bacterium]|nr:hypothetical protein [Polyangiaceae bacterium]